MKFFFFLIVMLSSNLSYSQDGALADSFKNDLCDCFINEPQGDLNNRFGLCFEQIKKSPKYAESVYKVSDSESESFYVRTIIELISSCDSFGNESILWFNSMLPIDKSKNTKFEINRLNSVITKEKNKDSLLLNLGFRMEVNYNARDIENTMKDIKMIQQLDSNNVTSRIIEANVYFHNNQYNNAIKCYEIIRGITKSDQFDIFIAIIERSKKMNLK